MNITEQEKSKLNEFLSECGYHTISDDELTTEISNQTLDDGMTPLWIAAKDDHTKVVKILIQAGAQLDKAIYNGATALLIAAQNGHNEIVKTLIQAGAQLDRAMYHGATPLLIAAQNGHIKIVKTLIQAGAQLDKAMYHGATPLYNAVQYNHIDIVQTLIIAGAKIDKAINNGWTPLFIAAQRSDIEIARLLVFAMSLSKTVIPDILPQNIAKDPTISMILSCSEKIFASLRDNLNLIAEDIKNDSWKKEAYRITLDFLYKNFAAANNLEEFLTKFTAKTKLSTINTLISKEQKDLIENMIKPLSKTQHQLLSNLSDVISAEIVKFLPPSTHNRLQNKLEGHFNTKVTRLDALDNHKLQRQINRADGEYTYSYEPNNGATTMVKRRLDESTPDLSRELKNSAVQRQGEEVSRPQTQSHLERLLEQRNINKQREERNFNIS